jgi:hypothetical protein
MTRPQPGLPGLGGDDEPLPRLADAKLPPRVRSLLEGMLDFAADELERGVVQVLNEFEQQLFKLADQPRNSDGQQQCFETLREVKRARSDVVPRFMMRLEGFLAQMRPIGGSHRRHHARSAHELSLVDEHTIEVDAVLREIAARAEVRNSLALYLMGQRFGVLAGAPAFEPEHIPIGPSALCEAMHAASACMQIPVEHEVLLLRQFDRMVMQYIGPFFEALNNYLVQQRVLPNLHFVPVRARPHARAVAEPNRLKTGQRIDVAGTAGSSRQESARALPTGAGSALAEGAARAGRAPQGQQVPLARGGVELRGPSGPGRAAGMAAPGGHAGVPPAGSHPVAPQQAPRWPGVPQPPGPVDDVEDPRDVELFNTMRELMAGRRSVLGKFGGRDAANAFSVSTDDVESVLGALQQKPMPSVVVGGKVQPRTVAALKQDLMAQLRRVTPEGKVPRLSDQDSDTIDLVGMLFDYIVRDLKPSGIAQSLLAKLQAPVLRTALRDKGFFTRRHHPARQLLNSIAETGMYWLDGEDADRGLVEKMQMLVDRVTSDFDGDVSLFETLLNDLSRHMQTLARKAEVAERRHVEAARGRERLEAARVHAGEEVAKRLADRRVPKLLAQLLEQTWTDVLALTELRQGVDSDIYRRRLAVTERLIEAYASRGSSGGALLAPTETQRLREEVEAGLAQVGHHASDIPAILATLFDTESPGSEHEEPASRTEIAMRLKARARLGADVGGESLAAATAELSEADKAAIQRIKSLPFGTWFEFVVNQQGDTARRRLSWFSTVTGRCLFVNQRGQRVDERSMVALARELQRGNVRIVEREEASIIDRAWNAILGALRHFSGKPAAVH